MIELFHVSDLHFGRSKRQNGRARKLLDAIYAKWQAEPSGAKRLIVTGDITNNGTRKEYGLASGALKKFAGNILVVPGNHDYGFGGFGFSRGKVRNFEDFAAALGVKHPFHLKEPYEQTIDNGEGHKLLLVGLNSCSMTPSILDISKGEIGDGQRAALHGVLSRPRGAVPAVVALHHIPHRRAEGIGMSLKDYRELMAVLRKRVKAVAFGHEGAMDGPGRRKPSKAGAHHRGLARRRGQGIRYLDANRSVADLAYYHVQVDAAGLTTRVVKI